MIRHCFWDKCVEMHVSELTPSKELPVNIKLSQKYKQIVLSIKALGLVEPVVICIQKSGETLKILDGHLRVEALKELNINMVPCIISPDEEAYTYNKHVNRLTVIQEQNMIRKAVDSGVPVEMLSSVLGITPSILSARFRLLDGICGEVVALLADKHVSRALFDVLRKMTPVRQIDVVKIMQRLNNFSKKFALSLLHGSRSQDLVNSKNSNVESRDHKASMKKLEREMASVQIDTEKLNDRYAENNLKLAVIQPHITRLLGNESVSNWLMEKKPDYFEQFVKISEIGSV